MANSTLCTAEYYFEYKIDRVFGDEKTIKTPKIYFERDYSTPNLPYTMFAVPEEWLNKQDLVNSIKGETNVETIKRTLSKLPYDTINVVFDIKGIACTPLGDKQCEEYEKAEIHLPDQTFEKFYQAGCRLTIENNNSQDHSGIGVIEMLKNDETVAKFFFAVNFTFRKYVSYKLEIAGKTVNLDFTCKDRPVGLEVVLLYNTDRLPCLRNDIGINNVAEPFVLEFNKHGKCHKEITLTGDAANKDNIFSVAIRNRKMAKYYILNCERNTSLPNQSDKKINSTVSYTCPFCHKKINYSVAKSAGYKHGGTSCSPITDVKAGKELPTIYNKHKSKLKKCLYCSGDLMEKDSSSFKSTFSRILPPSFMEHDNYKIAFVGSTRAGKTTYISRFFGLTGDKKVSMPMTMTTYSLKKFGINIKSAPILKVDRTSWGYQAMDSNWMDEQQQYIDRSINLNEPKYPDRTTTGDYTSFPFIAEVNNNTYVSFYDIAGEDAQHSMLIKNIANGDLIGIFCIINGKKDISGNNDVINMLKSAAQTVKGVKDDVAIDKNCPIAVIVTKMDTLESEFDSNCQCLRCDYFDSGKIYAGSEIERVINISSEEIRAYLKQNSLLPDFDGIYENVKYFGVSSFNFMDSIHNEMEDVNTPGRVKFECSSKRMELPFLWMLKQFGVIN
ncbi:MAG: hypothetical protein ACI4MQ_07850 [Candidatus Coproplasma sp.]